MGNQGYVGIKHCSAKQNAVKLLVGKTKQHPIVGRQRLLLGPMESRSAKKTPSHSWSGKVQDRGSRKSVGKESTIEQSVGKVYHRIVGREKFIAGPTESRSAIL